MRSIGLMGYARSGKDTAGKHLVDALGYTRVGFADGVRESLLALDPIVYADVQWRVSETRNVTDPRNAVASTFRLSDVVEHVGWERAKDEVPEVRALLQRMGTEAVRDVIGDDTWVRLASRKIGSLWGQHIPVVVTDVRFPNEAAKLRELGFTLVWVSRPGCRPANAHASEVGLSAADADAVVINAWDEEALFAQVSELAQ